MTVPAAGWYADPGGAGDERFWDGRQWTGQTRPPRLVSDWRGWLARSGKALTVGRLVAGLASLGATVALAIGLTALIRGEPTRGIGVLLVFAVPVVFVGQIWLIVLGRARMPSGRGWRGRSRMFGVRDARALFFGSLSWATAGPLLVLAFLGWLSAMTAFPSIANGGPTSPSSSCRYRLDSHGATSCVSREIYEHAGAGEQRFAAGILLAFFALHAGGALGGLAERKATVGDRG